MNSFTITTLSARWVSWAIPKHNKCSFCKKQLEPDEMVAIADFGNDYASAWCLDCAVLDLQGSLESLQGEILTIKDIQSQVGRD